MASSHLVFTSSSPPTVNNAQTFASPRISQNSRLDCMPQGALSTHASTFPMRNIPHQFQPSSPLQQFANNPMIVYSSGPAPLPSFIPTGTSDWIQQAGSYYRSPVSVSSHGNNGPYHNRQSSSALSSMSARGRSDGSIRSVNSARSGHSNTPRSPREILVYWKGPGRETELAIIQWCFLVTHIFVMKDADAYLSEVKISEYIDRATLLIRTGTQELGIFVYMLS